MAQNDYKINLGVKVKDNSKNETKKELDKIIKDLQKNFKVDLKLKTDALNKQIREYKKEVNSLTKQLEGLKTQLENVSKVKPQSGSFLAGIQKGSHKVTSVDGSKTLDVKLRLTPEKISKATITGSGISKTYKENLLAINAVTDATKKEEEQIVSITVSQQEANKVIKDAIDLQRNLAEELRKSGLSEDEIKTQEEYKKLEDSVESYKKTIKSLQEYLAKPEKFGKKNLASVTNEITKWQKKIESSSNEAISKINELTHSASSMEEVFSKLKEEGIDFSKFTFQSESGNITKYADELGRVVKITKEFDKEGRATYKYDLANNFKDLSKSAEDTYNKVQKLANGIVNLRRTSEVKQAEKVKEEIDDVYKSLVNLQNAITKTRNAQNKSEVNKLTEQYGSQKKRLDELSASYQKLTAQIKNQGGWMLNLKDSWTKAIRSFTTYMSVTTVFYQGVHAIKSMVNEVKNLDDSLTEFKKVSDLAGNSLDRYVKKAYEAGETVAKTGREMIDAATEFKKSGYTDDQSLELGKVALMYSNIADEEINAGDAASFIIAQLKAFNLEAEDTTKTLENAQHVIDSVNEVSNKFAVSSADIANNLGTASAVMANAGNSLEELIGLMAAGTEITRNAGKVANGKRIKPYIYSNMYINIVPNPVTPKAYDNYNIKMKYA